MEQNYVAELYKENDEYYCPDSEEDLADFLRKGESSGQQITSQHRNSGDLRTKNLSDNYLFARVMEDRELCRRVLEEILQVPIRNIAFVNTEESVRILPESKGIRMDVYVNDEEDTVYNVEMQTGDNDNLPKRARYYQDTMDLDQISAGQDYLKLKESFVIFICTFPLFGMDRHIYTFVNTCREDKSLELGDETVKIFLSTRGKLDDISRDLKEFLCYVEDSTDETAKKSSSRLVKDLHHRVQEIKDTRKYQVEYMTLYMHEQDIERKARAEGIEEGRREGHAAGLIEGHSAGLAEGRKAGIEEGRLDVLQETVHRMHSKGMDAKDIADLLALSEEQVTTWINIEET